MRGGAGAGAYATGDVSLMTWIASLSAFLEPRADATYADEMNAPIAGGLPTVTTLVAGRSLRAIPRRRFARADKQEGSFVETNLAD